MGLVLRAIAVNRVLPALILIAGFESNAAAQDSSGRIGYATVASALESLRAKSGVSVSRQSGWTIITEPSGLSLWSFTPEGHPAAPAVVHRQVLQEGGDFFVKMQVLCEAAKPACDALVADFEKLNQQMAEDLKRRKTTR
jgi:hypothetical protein